MNHKAIVEATIEFVKSQLADVESGHDWWHVYRVWKNSITIAEHEQVDMLVVELGALLHDVADAKFHNGDETAGPRKAGEFLNNLGIDAVTQNHVIDIIRNISFKNTFETKAFTSRELEVVQDADRLDALGAIGIARTFNYGGYRNREIYNPSVPPNMNMDMETYKKSTSPTLNHFYEKLLLLKDLMNTQSGKRMAEGRHVFLEQFLERFHQEWEGID